MRGCLWMPTHQFFIILPLLMELVGVCGKSVMNLFYGRPIKGNKKFIDDKYGEM